MEVENEKLLMLTEHKCVIHIFVKKRNYNATDKNKQENCTKRMTVVPSIEKTIGSHEVYKSCIYSFFNPKGKDHRFLALVFMCMIGIGPYFCYDSPSALQDNIMKEINITSTQFSLFYALYSWPSVIVSTAGGVLIDRYFGVCYGTIVFFGILIVGQVIFASGALLNTFWVMALGRFVFGLGADPLAISQTTYAAEWFKNKEISMVFGLQESCSNIGSVLNFWSMDPLYTWISNFYSDYKVVGIVLFISCLVCLFSMLCGVILGVIHQKAKKVHTQDLERTSNPITFTDVKNFPRTYWLLVIIAATYNASILSFFALAKVFFMNEFNTTSVDANRLSSLLYMISMIGAPFVGFAVDKLGKNVTWILIAVITTLISHCMLAFLPWDPYIGVVLMSIAKCIVTSAFYPTFTLMIPTHHLGTAVGLCWSFQSFFVGIITVLSGTIVDHLGYLWLEIFFILCLTVSLAATIGVFLLDRAHKGILNMTVSQRNQVVA